MKHLETLLHQNVDALLPCELGAVNVAVALHAGASLGKMVINGDGGGRSVPSTTAFLFFQTVRSTPMVMCNNSIGTSTPREAITVTTTDIDADLIVYALLSNNISSFYPCLGTAGYFSTLGELRNAFVPATLDMAIAVGKIVRPSDIPLQDRSKRVVDSIRKLGRSAWLLAMNANVTDIHTSVSMGRDIGRMILRVDGGSTLEVDFENENILLWEVQGNERSLIVTAPDSICLLPSSGEPMDVSTIVAEFRAGRQVVVDVMVVAAAKEYLTPRIVSVYEAMFPLFDYAGPYKPYEPKVGSSVHN